jgi:hypothetical protein
MQKTPEKGVHHRDKHSRPKRERPTKPANISTPEPK